VRYRALIVLALFLAAGCATPSRRRAVVAQDVGLDAAKPAAAALVFDAPVAYDGPPLELARDGRAPEAFVGYAEGVTEYFYLRWDDRQTNFGHGRHGGNFDYFERRAISEKVGALYR
jgi:hypothetical protein